VSAGFVAEVAPPEGRVGVQGI